MELALRGGSVQRGAKMVAIDVGENASKTPSCLQNPSEICRRYDLCVSVRATWMVP